jgi:O-methyltransferase involved in polyketide biosynthesis
MDVGGLTPVEVTALVTVYARALDSRSPRPVLADALADQVVSQIDYDFAGLGVTPSVVGLVALRAKMLDARIRRFTAAHPDAVVVDLGAGVGSTVFRVNPPPGVDWYSIDLPAVIALRDAVLPHRARSHTLAVSVAEQNWAHPIPADRPTMVVADGLFAFLTEPELIAALHTITGHFGSGVVAFNDYGTVGWVNRIGKLVTVRRRMFRNIYSQWGSRGFKDARHPETWNPALHLIDEASAMHEPEAALFPPLLRISSRVATRIPAIARKARIVQYQFPRAEHARPPQRPRSPSQV